MTDDNSDRLDRIQRLVESNAKSIEALTNVVAELTDDVPATQRQLQDTVRRTDDIANHNQRRHNLSASPAQKPLDNH